jgi:hypothetical protein
MTETAARPSGPELASRPSTAPRTLLGWLLPVVLVGAAVLTHWLLNVPPGPLPPPVQKDEPKKKESPATPAGDDDDDKDKGGDEPFTAPRSDTLLAQVREAYGAAAFKSEPTFEAWSAAHRPLINQVVASARVQAFKGVTPIPSISVTGVECHTIRCRFSLTSAKTEDIQKLIDTLQGLQLDGAGLWHSFKADPFVEEPSKRSGAAPRMRTAVEVSFLRDLPKVDKITLADGAPLKQPPTIPTAVPGSIPGSIPTRGSVPAHSTTAAPPGPMTPGAPTPTGTVPGGTATPKPVSG